MTHPMALRSSKAVMPTEGWTRPFAFFSEISVAQFGQVSIVAARIIDSGNPAACQAATPFTFGSYA